MLISVIFPLKIAAVAFAPVPFPAGSTMYTEGISSYPLPPSKSSILTTRPSPSTRVSKI